MLAARPSVEPEPRGGELGGSSVGGVLVSVRGSRSVGEGAD